MCKNKDGSWREVSVVVKRAVKVAFVILFNFFDKFGFLSAINALRKNGFYLEPSETHWNREFLIGLNATIILRIVWIPSYFYMQNCHLSLMGVQKCQGQRESLQMSFKLIDWEFFNGDFDVKSRISKPLNFVLLKDILDSFLIISEIINAIVLIWQIFKMVPLALFKTLQSLVILEFFSQILLCRILNFIFKL
jgi:hypothetical protein